MRRYPGHCSISKASHSLKIHLQMLSMQHEKSNCDHEKCFELYQQGKSANIGSCCFIILCWLFLQRLPHRWAKVHTIEADSDVYTICFDRDGKLFPSSCFPE